MTEITRTLELLARAKDGDVEALGRALARYSDRVRRIVRVRLGRPLRRLVDSGDIVQEALVVALRNWEHYDVRDEATLLNVLAKIAQRQITDQADKAAAKKRDVRREVSLNGAGSDSDAPGFDLAKEETSALDRQIKRERGELLTECLHELPASQRELIVLRDEMGMSWQQVADELRKPTANAARNAYALAMARLTRLLKARGGFSSDSS